MPGKKSCLKVTFTQLEKGIQAYNKTVTEGLYTLSEDFTFAGNMQDSIRFFLSTRKRRFFVGVCVCVCVVVAGCTCGVDWRGGGE